MTQNPPSGKIPEDMGGLSIYLERIQQLTGNARVELDGGRGYIDHVDPTSEHWWAIMNSDFRKKTNMRQLFVNPMEFNIEKTRADLDFALRRASSKRGQESISVETHDFRNLGLAYEGNSRVSASNKNDPTKICAVCGVTAALRKCSACDSVVSWCIYLNMCTACLL